MIKKIDHFTVGLEMGPKEVRMVDLMRMGVGFKFNICYAETQNFIGIPVYPVAAAFLLEHVALDLKAVHEELRDYGYGVLVFDGYRPWSVTKLFWDRSSDHDRQFLADPERGSSHNRGCAIDLSMFHLKTGEPVEMPSAFDEMNEKAFVNYEGGTQESRQCRDLLQQVMRSHQFTGIQNEWWHFNHQSHRDWPVMDIKFEEILLNIK